MIAQLRSWLFFMAVLEDVEVPIEGLISAVELQLLNGVDRSVEGSCFLVRP